MANTSTSVVERRLGDHVGADSPDDATRQCGADHDDSTAAAEVRDHRATDQKRRCHVHTEKLVPAIDRCLLDGSAVERSHQVHQPVERSRRSNRRGHPGIDALLVGEVGSDSRQSVSPGRLPKLLPSSARR